MLEAATSSVRGRSTTIGNNVSSRKLSPVLVAEVPADVVEDVAAVDVVPATEVAVNKEIELKAQQEAQQVEEEEELLRATETIDTEAYEITNEELARIQMDQDMARYELEQAKLLEENDVDTGIEKKETKLIDTETEAQLHLQETLVHEKEIVSREIQEIDFKQGSGLIEVVVAAVVDGNEDSGGTDTNVGTITTIQVVDKVSAKVIEITGTKAEKLAAHTVINKDDYESDEYNYEDESEVDEDENFENDPEEDELNVQDVRGSGGHDISSSVEEDQTEVEAADIDY